MAQPQGLNVPAIVTTGICTALLTGIIIEGVRALYNYEEPREAARKWDDASKNTAHEIRSQQERKITFDTNVPIDHAMELVVQSGGKMPTTKPGI
ncbi:MAG: hypothetical protein QM754_03865 [Tepidisphaeraceae bacterium]